jgi:DnaD/phage-associated family protein
MVTEQEDIVYIVHYGERQKRAPSDMPEQIRERMQRHRAKKAAEHESDVTALRDNETTLQRGVTTSDTDTEVDTETETVSDSETEKIQTQKASVAVSCAPLPDDCVAQGIRYYESKIGLVSGGIQSEEMTDTLAELRERGISDWWNTAIDIAVDNNKRAWSYVNAILRNHLKSGTAPVRTAGPLAGPPKPQKQKVKVRDPDTGAIVEREAMI